MPYIGNNHIVGDHINNFKVLDDISSYTATFDGSSTNVVSTSDETLRIVEHRFVQGQRVTYNNGGGSNIGGLASGTAYYVSFDTANTIKLATSLVNANNGTLINLTSAGGGTTHTLTAAFDSTNTKFKLTHNGGESGRFNNATQLQVAINNVLQRPNSNPDNFTEGFAVEGGNKIVFQTAPTSNDIFWGSIIANSLPTFDIDAAAIDNFTGDGSTTDFTLSRIPPNNASIIVTINGVFQHLSDTTTARAYSLEASVIKFTSAPASGDEIQVRHTGFRGALGDIVTGFYGRTGNVTLTAADDILTRNINSSGIITASSFSGDGSGLIGVASTDNIVTGTAATFNTYPVDINAGMTVAGVATFAGNVSIAGTLTYEDVKNVDSIGIITARNGIDCNGDIDVDGHTNLDNVSVAGVSTFQNNVHLLDNDNLYIGGSAGTTDGIRIHHNGNNSFVRNTNRAFYVGQESSASEFGLYLHAGNEFYLKHYASNGGQNTVIKSTRQGAFILYYGAGNVPASGTERLETTSTGINFPRDIDVDGHTNLDNVSIAGVSTFTGAIDANGDLDVDGHTNLDNVSIAGVTTFASNVSVGNSITVTGLIQASSGSAGSNKGIKVGNSLTIEDVGNVRFAHTGASSFYYNAVNHELRNVDHQRFIVAGSAVGNGVGLFHYNSGSSTEKLRVTSSGVTVYGTAVATGADINGDLDVDGHTNLDNVSIAGVTTFASAINGSGQFVWDAADADVIIRDSTDSPQNFIYRDHSASKLYLGTTSNVVELRSNLLTNADSTYDIGTNSVRWRNVYADTYYGDGSNLTNVISGVDVKFEGASVGTGVTMLNFVGFNTVTAPVSGLSTITSGQNLTIGVRSGSAVEASLTGTSFNVIARSGGNISINI